MTPGTNAGLRRASRFGRWRFGFRVVASLGWLTLALGACIIEERGFSQQLSDCWEYCNRVGDRCTGDNTVYENREVCNATCMQMQNGGEIGDTIGNTLACRLALLRAGIEPTQCEQVGPGSAGECGNNCTALCALRKAVCANVTSQTEQSDVNDTVKCETECAALFERESFDASDTDLRGDTVQCRLVYVSRAALSTEEAALHCEHSQIRPTPGENTETAPCSDPPLTDAALECKKYCELVTTACTGEFAMYDSAEECLNTCAETMVPGLPKDQTLDTIRCRRYHAYFALIAPEQHCLHAGPTGDGHCGAENCTPYCRIAQEACGEEFGRAFDPTVSASDGGLAACAATCLPETPDGPAKILGGKRDEFALATPERYHVDPAPTGNTLMCRTFHAIEALDRSMEAQAARPAHCAAAMGGAPCR
ncbi:MAG: hypothetical protein RL033_1675 [Pseudomonadota bacterium]|jgi:hypothetical protein